MVKQEILIVDDEKLDRHLLKTVLLQNGYLVIEAGTGEEGIKQIREREPSMVIIDLNLGGISGLDLCAAIKSDEIISHIPILILTGDDEAGLNISCLDQGADDYMVKPFDRKEIVARIRAILRRMDYSGRKIEVLNLKGVSLDPGRRVVLAGDQLINNLTPKEFDLLFFLMKNSPNIVERSLISRKVWNLDLGLINERTIDVHIRRIRLKLGPAFLGRLITVSGKGYRFD